MVRGVYPPYTPSGPTTKKKHFLCVFPKGLRYIHIHIYTPLRQDGPTDDARVSLLRQDSPDPETREPVAPPWAGRVEGLNYQISR